MPPYLTVSLYTVRVIPLICVYILLITIIVGKNNELMNLFITYTYLLICPLSPPPPSPQFHKIQLHLYYGLCLWDREWTNMYFQQFCYGQRNFCSSCNLHNLVGFPKSLIGRIQVLYSLLAQLVLVTKIAIASQVYLFSP